MSYFKIDSWGAKYWYNDQDQIHRDDGPAIEDDGDYWWYQNGLCHRLDGPAAIWKDGSKRWCYKGIDMDCQSQEEFEKKIKLLAFL